VPVRCACSSPGALSFCTILHQHNPASCLDASLQEVKHLELRLTNVRVEVFATVTLKNAVFSYVTACGFCKDGRFGRKCRLLLRGGKNQRARYNVSSY
jgi:hypothetical protein